MNMDEMLDMNIAPNKPESKSIWPTTLLGEILEGRQKNAEKNLRAAVSQTGRDLWSKVIIEYSYAIAADRAGNDEHCKIYSQRAIMLESDAIEYDASYGL
jgi:hypothetical protein